MVREFRQTFGGVLTVAVHKGNKIEALFDRVMETAFLVAAVTLIDRVKKGMQSKRKCIFFPYRRTTLKRPID